MSNNYENIIVSKENGIITITLNRPKFYNAISPELLHEVDEAVSAAAKDDEAKVIVITGTGKAFCSGGDIELDVSKISEMTTFEWRKYDMDFCETIKRIYWIEKPVIAAVNGIAGGGGLDIALACDIRIASEEAKFANFYIRMGLIPIMGGNYFLPRLIGLGRAKLMAFTGDFIDAKQAERIGLVDITVPAGEFSSTVKTLAQKLANGPTKAIGMTKIAMNKSMHMDLDMSMDYSSSAQVLLFSTEDHKEGLNAFFEKRKTQFKGK